MNKWLWIFHCQQCQLEDVPRSHHDKDCGGTGPIHGPAQDIQRRETRILLLCIRRLRGKDARHGIQHLHPPTPELHRLHPQDGGLRAERRRSTCTNTSQARLASPPLIQSLRSNSTIAMVLAPIRRPLRRRSVKGGVWRCSRSMNSLRKDMGLEGSHGHRFRAPHR